MLLSHHQPQPSKQQPNQQQPIQRRQLQQQNRQPKSQQLPQAIKLHPGKVGDGQEKVETSTRRASTSLPPSTDGTKEQNTEPLDWNLVNDPPSTSPPVSSQWFQDMLIRSPDEQGEFDFMADLNSFQYDEMISDFTDLDGVFDVPGSLHPDEDVQPEAPVDATSHNVYHTEPIVADPPRPTQSKRPFKQSPSTLGRLPSLTSRGRPVFTSSYRRTSTQNNSLISLSDSAIFSSLAGSHSKKSYGQAGISQGRPSKFQLQSTADNACSRKCHATLTEQLSCLGEWRSEECNLSLDVLLRVDSQICREREKVISCPVCLGKTRSRQTLMLIIMVMEKLLSLFEIECNLDRLSNAFVVNEDESLVHCQVPMNNECTNDSGILPGLANLPLVVGSFEVDEMVKTIFIQHLLRIHFEKQLTTLSKLDQFLSHGTKDVSYKVTCELLVDMHRRIEYIHGLLVSI